MLLYWGCHDLRTAIFEESTVTDLSLWRNKQKLQVDSVTWYQRITFRSWENILIQCAPPIDWRRPRPQLNLEGWRTVPIGNRTGHANLRAIIRLFFPPACNNLDDIIFVQKFVWYETNQMLMKYKILKVPLQYKWDIYLVFVDTAMKLDSFMRHYLKL